VEMIAGFEVYPPWVHRYQVRWHRRIAGSIE
jgi:hypothetical protein